MDYLVDKDSNRIIYGGMKNLPYLWDDGLEKYIHDEIMGEIGGILYSGMNVIYDETCMRRTTRAPFIALAKELKVTTRAIVFPDKGGLVHVHRRMNYDARGYSWDDWEAIYRRKQSMYEAPTHEEGFDYIFESDGLL